MNQSEAEVINQLNNISFGSESDSFQSNLKCRVCDDVIHKKVTGTEICNGCKSFFRRSVLNDKKYVCYFDQVCHLNPKALKKCRYCRLIFCLKYGLSLKNYHAKSKKTKKAVQISESSSNSNTFTSENYFKLNQNQEVVFNSLREQSLQIFMEQSQIFARNENQIDSLMSTSKTITYQFSPEFIEYVRHADFLILKNHSNTMLNIIKSLPGFSKLNQNDLKSIMNAHFFTILGLLTINLFKNDDYFLLLDENIQMDKHVFAILFGDYVRDFVFKLYFHLKSFNLAKREIGLMVPFLLSSINYNLENSDTIKEINEYYSRTLFNEFNLNKRSIEFLQEFSHIVCLAPKMNQLCMNVKIEQNAKYSSI